MRVLQRLAVGWCVLVAGLLAILQFSGIAPMPLPLFLAFAGVWLFGAAMLVAYPTFGAIGTGVYGVLLGTQLLLQHGATPLTVGLTLACYAGSALAVAFLVERRRSLRA